MVVGDGVGLALETLGDRGGEDVPEQALGALLLRPEGGRMLVRAALRNSERRQGFVPDGDVEGQRRAGGRRSGTGWPARFR